MDSDKGFSGSSERKKIKMKCKFCQFNQFFYIFNVFFIRKVHDWRTILGHVGGENKKKAELSFFVGPVSSTSEDSATVEYSERGLNY